MFSESAIRFLRDHADIHQPAKDSFYEHSSEKRAQLFTALKEARVRVLDETFLRFGDVWESSSKLGRVRKTMYSYFDRSDWAFLDLIALAVPSPAPVEHIARHVAPNAVVYHALRMLDDILDSHHDYKGGERTLFGELAADPELCSGAAAANLIPAMIFMVHTGVQLPSEDRSLIENTLMGMLRESFSENCCAPDSYREIALAKMGSYGLFLYRPVIRLFDPDVQPVLTQFLQQSFYVAQIANDLQDQNDDRQRGQPNYWSAWPSAQQATEGLFDELQSLSSTCLAMPGPVQGYAHSRIADLIRYLLQVDQLGASAAE